MLNIRLKEEREKKGLSQAQLAEEIGISRNSVYNYESGERTPNIDVLLKLSNFFNVSTDYLLGKSNDKSNKPSKNDMIVQIPAFNRAYFTHGEAIRIIKGGKVQYGLLLEFDTDRLCFAVVKYDGGYKPDTSYVDIKEVLDGRIKLEKKKPEGDE